MPAIDDDTMRPFSALNISKKKVTAAFDGGEVSPRGGVFVRAAADKRPDLIDRPAGLISGYRDQAQSTHSMADLSRGRVFTTACGYPDGDDLDDLRHDPAFKMARGRGYGCRGAWRIFGAGAARVRRERRGVCHWRSLSEPPPGA